MNEEVFFNELCLQEKPDDYSVFTNLKEAYFRLKKEGFSICRIDGVSKQRVLNYLESINGTSRQIIRGFFFAFFHAPYEKADMTDDENELSMSHDLFYGGDRAEGFLWAHVYDSLSLSLYTNPKWDTPCIGVVDRANSNQSVIVHHVCTEKNIDNQVDWFDSIRNVEIIETTLLPSQKKISLAGTHHGIHELKQFWKRIRNSPYIERCITSTDYHSFEKELVRTVFPDGKIEIVLFWEKPGYSLLLQTTGRNIRETKAIADILSEEYSR